jgi:hypothetical protein
MNDPMVRLSQYKEKYPELYRCLEVLTHPEGEEYPGQFDFYRDYLKLQPIPIELLSFIKNHGLS